MTKVELRALTLAVKGELEDRMKLGAYNAEAESIIRLWDAVWRIVEHLEETAPLPKK